MSIIDKLYESLVIQINQVSREKARNNLIELRDLMISSKVFDLGPHKPFIDNMESVITDEYADPSNYNPPYDRVILISKKSESDVIIITSAVRFGCNVELRYWEASTLESALLRRPEGPPANFNELPRKALKELVIEPITIKTLIYSIFPPYNKGELLIGSFNVYDNSDIDRGDATAKATSMFGYSLFASFAFFFNTKNISSRAITPDKKLVKARRKKGKKPPFTYHILEVSRPTKNNKASGTGTGSKQRLHMCRGHFREYTEEKPLFGKITGRFWIPAHARGDEEMGKVAKDYKIKA